ncbi:MAG: acetyltransferase [Nitrospirota bacterium]
MFLKQKSSGSLVEILDIEALFDPIKNAVSGRLQAGEELQEPEDFAKSDLVFPSGEGLPRCWVDRNYRYKD